MMNCDKTISLLLELLEDEIDPKTKKEFLGHLQECPPLPPLPRDLQEDHAALLERPEEGRTPGAHEQVDDFPTPAR
jgi:hypothetical protein